MLHQHSNYVRVESAHITKKTYYFSRARTFWYISTSNFSTLYTKIPHDKLLDILSKVIDFVFKGGTRDYIIINKQVCASWSSKKRGHLFVFTKSLLKEAIKFLLHNCFSLLEISQ